MRDRSEKLKASSRLFEVVGTCISRQLGKCFSFWWKLLTKQRAYLLLLINHDSNHDDLWS
ncbi:hypothetical protein YC2023_051892 [Brassica napus]